MRFHVISLPHTQTKTEFSSCAFTQDVIGFCKMMKGLGHTVFLYAGAENEAPCDELVTCIRPEQHPDIGHYTQASFDWKLPHWVLFNTNVIEEIRSRAEPHDFICVIGGKAHKEIADAFPHMMTVEFAIGYGGTFAKYRVWKSYAWMHACYGSTNTNTNAIDGQWFDAVIPGYLDPAMFPFKETKDNYYLFIGRLTDRKGFQIAADVCEKLGERLIIAGPGAPPKYGAYIGVVGPEDRGRLLAGAKAVFAPTQYIEPFGMVAIEAMACGTPVITTDWGAFVETNIHGVTGFRCRTFGEFCQAAKEVLRLDPERIRAHAMSYSLDAIAPKYDAYFKRLGTLWGQGWYAAHY